MWRDSIVMMKLIRGRLSPAAPGRAEKLARAFRAPCTSLPAVMRRWAASLAFVACVAPAPAAMRIILTNDDGFESANIQALFTALKAAGHDVILRAPHNNG